MSSSIWEMGTPEEYEKLLKNDLQKDIATLINSETEIINFHLAEIEKRKDSLWTNIFFLAMIICTFIYYIITSGHIMIRCICALLLPLSLFIWFKLNILPILKKNREDEEAIINASSNRNRAKEICEERLKNKVEIYRKGYAKRSNHSEKNDTNIFARNISFGSGDINTHDRDVNHLHLNIDAFLSKTDSDKEMLSNIIDQIKESNEKLSQLVVALEKVKNNNPEGKIEARAILADLANIVQIIATFANWLN